MENENHDYQQFVAQIASINAGLQQINTKLFIGNHQPSLMERVALHDDYIEQDKIHKAEDRINKAAMMRNIKGGLIANALTLVMIALTLFKIFS